MTEHNPPLCVRHPQPVIQEAKLPLSFHSEPPAMGRSVQSDNLSIADPDRICPALVLIPYSFCCRAVPEILLESRVIFRPVCHPRQRILRVVVVARSRPEPAISPAARRYSISAAGTVPRTVIHQIAGQKQRVEIIRPSENFVQHPCLRFTGQMQVAHDAEPAPFFRARRRIKSRFFSSLMAAGSGKSCSWHFPGNPPSPPCQNMAGAGRDASPTFIMEAPVSISVHRQTGKRAPSLQRSVIIRPVQNGRLCSPSLSGGKSRPLFPDIYMKL